VTDRKLNIESPKNRGSVKSTDARKAAGLARRFFACGD
jgi:hypothetical protein